MQTTQQLECRPNLTAYQLILNCPDQSMRQVAELVQKGTRSRSVVLSGETGVGKEVVAQALHDMGPHGRGKLVVVNCGNQNSGVMGSELFGHEKGSFTGAIDCHKGPFEIADKGTVFFDEIGELPLELQSRLLRVLESRSFTRVGGTTVISSDFHVISATNQDLWAMVQRGKFRRDLYYRLNVFSIPIPPLRERPKDTEYLSEFFTKEFTQGRVSLSLAAKDRILGHSWPGNVRELRNVIERAVIMVNGDAVILPAHLALAGDGTRDGGSTNVKANAVGNDPVAVCEILCDLMDGRPLEESVRLVEAVIIKRVFLNNRRDVSVTALKLGMSRGTLENRLKLFESDDW